MLKADNSVYRFDDHQGIWCRRVENNAFVYTDGDAVEQRLLEIVSSAADLTVLSPELAASANDWPSRYHLSSMRANLLRPIGELLRGDTLELGAGCGALTRFLGESGGNVVAVEGSRTRAGIAARRCRGLSNVQIVCDRVQDLEADQQFDAVTLVGVPEYARVYGDGIGSCQRLLESCRRFLKPGGCLILAIENRLGLKYLAGALGDHALQAMHGINDVYDPSSVVTFGRRELESLLRQSGFHDLQVLLPFPDYKLPTVVVFPKGYLQFPPDFDLGAFIANTVFIDQQKPSSPFFSLERAWRVVARNLLVPDLANSFLIVARTGPASAPLGPSNEDVFFKHYAAQRRPAFCKQLTFTGGHGRLRMVSEALSPSKSPDLPIRIRLETHDYVAGEVWGDRLAGVLNRPGWSVGDVVAWARPWVDLLRSAACGSGIQAVLPHNYLDALPFNLIFRRDGNFQFFDLEWELSDPPEIGYVFFRGLYWSLIRTTSVSSPADPSSAVVLPLIVAVAANLGLAIAHPDVQRYLDRENQVRSWIGGVSATLAFETVSIAGLNVRQVPPPFPESVQAAPPRQEEELASAMRVLQQQQQRQQEEAAALSGELANAQAEIDTLRGRTASYAESLAESSEKQATADLELATLREQAAADSERIAATAEKLAAAETEITALHVRGADYSGEIETLSERIAQTEAGLREADARARALAARSLEDRPGSKRTPGRTLSWRPSSLHRALLRFLYATPAFRWTGQPLARLISSLPVSTGGFLLPPRVLFDASFYTAQYPDTRNLTNPWAHYLATGASEGRNPRPLFDTRYYLLHNPDVAVGGVNPLVHYFEYGAAEGRNPSASFDTSWYLGQQSDVREADLNPLLHFWVHGRGEGRLPLPPRREASSSPDVLANGRSLDDGPTICVIMPTWNTPTRYLRLAIDSVLRQTYQHWRLCIYDDGSTTPETIHLLKEYSHTDRRISVRLGASNSGIANASNAALAMAEGDYVAMLDHDDEITPDALLEVAYLLGSDPSIDVVYTDQAYVDADGGSIEPFFKPDWSPELFRGVMYVGHLLVVRLRIAQKLGGFDSRFDRAQDFEFMLRLSEATTRIRHLRKVLYYWRRIPGSVAFHGDEKGAVEPIQAAAVNAHLLRCRIPATAAPYPGLAHRLTLQPNHKAAYPAVRILVREAAGASLNGVRSLLELSTYPNFKVALPAAIASQLGLPDERIQVYDPSLPEDDLSSDYVVCMDADLEVITPDWMQHLLHYCEQPDVACAAPLLVQPDGSVWQGGQVLGMGEGIDSPLRGWPADSDGYAGSLSCAREVTAVSGECLMISASLWRDLGRSRKYYALPLFEGADLALQAFTMKRRNILTPRARLRKPAPVVFPPGWSLDRALFRDRWEELIKMGDPYYNSNFALSAPGYSAAPGRSS